MLVSFLVIFMFFCYVYVYIAVEMVYMCKFSCALSWFKSKTFLSALLCRCQEGCCRFCLECLLVDLFVFWHNYSKTIDEFRFFHVVGPLSERQSVINRCILFSPRVYKLALVFPCTGFLHQIECICMWCNKLSCMCPKLWSLIGWLCFWLASSIVFIVSRVSFVNFFCKKLPWICVKFLTPPELAMLLSAWYKHDKLLA